MLLNKQLSQAQVGGRETDYIICEKFIVLINLLSQKFTGLVKRLPLNYIPYNFEISFF